MYIIAIQSRRSKRRLLFAAALLCLVLLLIIPVFGAVQTASDNHSDKSERYPGEPIRVQADYAIEDMAVWEAILQHYSF